MKTTNKISVVIPAYNEEDWIQLPLESLQDQNFDGSYEIVVVNNASTDDTNEIARDFGVKVVDEPQKGYTRACQTGFDAAKFPIIAVTDADTIVSENWLAEIGKTLSKPDVIGAYGPITFHDAGGYLNWLAKYGFTAFLKMNSLLGKPHFDGFNMAVSKEAFEEVGGFNLSMKSASDVDLSQRLKKHGKILYNKDMTVETSARRLEDWGFKFFLHHAINYINVVWLRRPEKARDFDDIR
jgi:glycosyltransferase involved in cell wall biosynthesis